MPWCSSRHFCCLFLASASKKLPQSRLVLDICPLNLPRYDNFDWQFLWQAYLKLIGFLISINVSFLSSWITIHYKHSTLYQLMITDCACVPWLLFIFHIHCSRILCEGTAAAAPLPFRPSDPAVCGSCPLVTPYYCRLGDLLCYTCMLYLFTILCVYPYV